MRTGIGVKAASVVTLLIVVAGTLATASAAPHDKTRAPDVRTTAPRPNVPGFEGRGSSVIRLASGPFDPLVDSMAPSGFDVVGVSDLEPGQPAYWLVQAEAGKVSVAVEAIERAGGLIAGAVPNRTFAVQATPAQRALFDGAAGVRWSGVYQPAWKVPPRTNARPGLLDLGGRRDLLVWLFADEPDPAGVMNRILRIDGIEIVDRGPRALRVRGDSAQVRALAQVQGVEWISVPPKAVPLNAAARWVNDTGIRDVFAATAPGRLTGSGQTAAVADTAINYVRDAQGRAQAYFRDCGSGSRNCKRADYTQQNSGADPEDLATVIANGTNHRKLAAYFDIGGSGTQPPDESSHGTHVAGSVTGDIFGNKKWNRADGMAPGARLVHQNISSPSGGLVIPNDSYDLMAQAYRPRDPGGVPRGWDPADYSNYIPTEDARTHNNSYGLIVPLIDDSSANRMDEFVWDHEDMLVVVSAGNSGPVAGSIGSPSVGKNIMSSAASANGEQPMVSIDSLAIFSSHGPTADGRYGPTVATPGQIVISAKGGGAADEHTLQGTSMSGPVLTGLATLVREYFYEGYGPAGGDGFGRGRASDSRRHNPSAALVKAALVNGAVRMRGYYTGDDGDARALDGQWPSAGQGFGLVNLDNSLFFPQDDLNNFYVDVWRNDPDAFTFPSGPQEHTYSLQAESGRPLDVTLAWTDAPNLLPAGTPALVNNLDLVVTAPDGTVYVGNNTNSRVNPAVEEHETVPGDAAPDSRNLQERVRIAAPQPGEYTVTVSAPELLDGPQGFALAASGAFAGAPERGAGLLPDEPGRPIVSAVRVKPITRDTAVATWRTGEPTTGRVRVTRRQKTFTYIDSYNVGPGGFRGLNEGPVETSEEYANKPMLGVRHRALLTGLRPNRRYRIRAIARDRSGKRAQSRVRTFRSPNRVFGANASDIGQLYESSGPNWRVGTQLYVGSLGAGDGALGAFMFRFSNKLNSSAITGAAVQLLSHHQLANAYTDDARYVVDLLDESVEPNWGTQEYQQIREARARARLNPVMADRIGGGVEYTYSLTCTQLNALRNTLRGGGQRRAAFRALGLTDQDTSAFSYEFGFNRRSRGPDTRPRLMLFMRGRDPLPCKGGRRAPKISDVSVAPGLGDERTSAVVSWRTNVASDSVVLFRKRNSRRWIQVGTPVKTRHHMIAVDNLDPNARYEFAVRSKTCRGGTRTDTNRGRGYAFFPRGIEIVSRTEIASFGFEAGAEGWTTTSNSSNPAQPPWERSSPGNESEFAFRIPSYFDESEEIVTSPEIASPGGEILVEFQNARDTELGFDYLNLEYSTDGGASWKEALSVAGQNRDFPDFSKAQDLFETPAGPLLLRFRFQSDELISSPLYTGVAVDDVVVSSVETVGGNMGTRRLAEAIPATSAGANRLSPPATRRRPTPADKRAGTALCGLRRRRG
ncbi:MAG: S8 family serine peptidase [Actinomycetota bacterium]